MWPEGCSWYAEGEQPLILVSTVSHALTSVGAHGCILDKLVSSTKISQTLQRQLQLPGQGQSSHGKDSQPPKAVTVPQHGMAGSRAPWKMQNWSIWISKTNHIWRGKDIFPARKYFYCRSKAVYFKKIIPFKPLRKEDLNKKSALKVVLFRKNSFQLTLRFFEQVFSDTAKISPLPAPQHVHCSAGTGLLLVCGPHNKRTKIALVKTPVQGRICS